MDSGNGVSNGGGDDVMRLTCDAHEDGDWWVVSLVDGGRLWMVSLQSSDGHLRISSIDECVIEGDSADDSDRVETGSGEYGTEPSLNGSIWRDCSPSVR